MSTPTTTDAVSATGNATYYLAKTIVAGFAAGCLYFSFSHTIELAHMLGATGAQAYTTPAFLDGFMLLGRLGMSTKFDAATNKIGRRMMTVGAILSLASNVLAGQTPGDRIIGAMVVSGFLVAEWYAGKLRPAPALTPAQKGAQTKARNAALKATTGQAQAKKAPAKRQAATTTKTNAAKTPARARKTTVKPANAIVAAAMRTYPNFPVSPAPAMTNTGIWITTSPADVKTLTN